uniref:Uncharacterized protein n=1 Tax=Anguilla anguilla TaxID=7936 RepID=A0A0E9RVP5_ANGAN
MFFHCIALNPVDFLRLQVRYLL